MGATMLDNLNEIELKVLDTLYRIKYKGYKPEDNIFNMRSNIESIKEVIRSLERLEKEEYISYEKLPLKQGHISNAEYINLDWYSIFISTKGSMFIEKKEKHDKAIRVEKMNYIIRNNFRKAIKIISSHDTYYEISIKAENKVVNGIKIDKHLLYKIREYSWFVNNYNNIVSYRGLFYGIKRNKAIYQILFEEEINKINQETGYIPIAHFKNGDKLDNRRENIIFIPKGKQALYKNLNKITGIYLSSSNTENNKSYEVKMKKNNEQIYLTKTTSCEEALKGAFLLRLIFYGKNFTNAFVEKLDIDQGTLNNLDEEIKNYIETNDIAKFKNALYEFNIGSGLAAKLINVITNKKHLI